MTIAFTTASEAVIIARRIDREPASVFNTRLCVVLKLVGVACLDSARQTREFSSQFTKARDHHRFVLNF
jgi:hypothetical protein